MKNKSIIAAIVSVMLLVLSSCSLMYAPESWKTEIDDSFRAQVALAQAAPHYETEKFELMRATLELKAEKHENEDYTITNLDVKKYKTSLEVMAEGNPMAEEVLELYKKVPVCFTEFTKAPKEGKYSVWTATEENTGIKVTFKNSSDMMWVLELNQENLKRYLLKLEQE